MGSHTLDIDESGSDMPTKTSDLCSILELYISELAETNVQVLSKHTEIAIFKRYVIVVKPSFIRLKTMTTISWADYNSTFIAMMKGKLCLRNTIFLGY